MSEKKIPEQPTWGGHTSVASYALGYSLCIFLTILAFTLVWTRPFGSYLLRTAITTLAVLQAWVQLRFFFNFGKEEKPRWNFWAFFFMALLLLIVFIGTLIIMSNLDYRMMEP